MNTISIKATEKGLVRVFSLSMTSAEAQALKNSPEAQFASMRGEEVNTGYIEIFPVTDLEEIGLVGYLTSGCGVDPASLEADRAKLAALEGWVMLVFSRAFRRIAQDIHPVPELTLIGTYAEPGVDWSEDTDLTSDAANKSPVKKTPSDAAMSGRIATLALGVIAIITVIVVWVAG